MTDRIVVVAVCGDCDHAWVCQQDMNTSPENECPECGAGSGSEHGKTYRVVNVGERHG